MNRLRVCFVTSEYPPGPAGGIGTFTKELASGLIEAGHEASVVGIYPDIDRPSVETVGDVTVQRIHQPRVRKAGPFIARANLFASIRRRMLRSEFDLVEVPDFEGWAAHWPRLPGPVVVRLHATSTFLSDALGWEPSVRMRKLEATSLRRRDAWCSPSRFLAERTKQLFGEAGEIDEIIPHGIRDVGLRPFEQRSHDDVVFAGTLNELKGVLPLLRAWPGVRAAHRTAQLHLYGKRGFLDERVLDDALSGLDGVTEHGPVPRSKVVAALGRARVAVFPSLVEGFGMAPLEAMATGCSTIFTRRGAGPELVEHEVDGLLVDPSDPADIARSIVRVLHDDAFARRISESGRRKTATTFAFDRWVDHNAAFYRNVVERWVGR